MKASEDVKRALEAYWDRIITRALGGWQEETLGWELMEYVRGVEAAAPGHAGFEGGASAPGGGGNG